MKQGPGFHRPNPGESGGLCMKTIVKRRPLGATGLTVSEVSLGAMNLRMLKDREEGVRLVNFALDQGINLIDTARAYKGVTQSGVEVQSEEIVGSVIRSRSDLDEPIVIVTKGHGYNPQDFEADLMLSHKTLGIEKRENGLFIGQTEIKLVVFMHGIKADRWEEIQETGAIQKALELKEQGWFHFLGFSSHYGDGETIRAALDTGAYQVVELPYNVYKRTLGEDGEPDLLRYAHDKGVGIVNMKAFNGNGMVATSKLIRDICSITYEDMLRFCLANPYISTVDAGARFPEEFLADTKVSTLPPLSDEQRKALTTEADQVSGLFDNICRECMHCLEKFQCPQGIPFPEILGLHSRYTIAKALSKDAAPYAGQYAQMGGPKADACVACGGCNAWCEYHLDIPAMMAQVRKDLA